MKLERISIEELLDLLSVVNEYDEKENIRDKIEEEIINRVKNNKVELKDDVIA